VQLDTALNLIWLTLSVFAIASTLRAYRQRSKPAGPRWLQVCGVALVLAALFPYISATDDVLRIQQLNTQQKSQPHESGKKVPNSSLVRLYETLETSVVATVGTTNVVLIFLALVVAPIVRLVSRARPLTGGRSPPVHLLPC